YPQILLPLWEKVARQGRMRGVGARFDQKPPDRVLAPLIRPASPSTFSHKGRRDDGLARDLAEVGDAVHDAAHLAQQLQAVFPLFGHVGVDHDGGEEGVDRSAQARKSGHGGGEVLGLQRGVHSRGGGGGGEGQGGLFRRLVRQAGGDGACRQRSLLLFGLEQLGGALVARQQVRPVVRRQEGGQRLHPTHDPHQIVVAQSEDGRHKVVALALVAQEDGQAVHYKQPKIEGASTLPLLRRRFLNGINDKHTGSLLRYA